MSAAGKRPSAVATPDGSGLVISPPNRLKDKVCVSGTGPLDEAAIRRAEDAIAELSDEFEGWMREEINTLFAAHRTIKSGGLTTAGAEALFIAAHDLKGQAEMFGFPLIGRICASLCRLFDADAGVENIPAGPIDNHIDAVRAAIAQDIRDDESASANAVLAALCEQTDAFFDMWEAKHRQAEAPEREPPQRPLEDIAEEVGADIVAKAE